MRIVVAPDSFKESLTAVQAACAIEEGFYLGWPEAEIVRMPMADGGEGTTAAIVAATHGQMIEVDVTGPLGEPMRCSFGLTGDGETAVVELAAASGLESVPAHLRNPLRTTTFGSGQLIRAALAHQPRRLLIGLGGSATVDGGAGLLQALGARLLDARGREIPRTGEGLGRLVQLDLSRLDPRLRTLEILAACDVDSPLVGPAGAAAVFGPQKGATPAMVQQLNQNLLLWAGMLELETGVAAALVAGSGAAGGVGAALIAGLGARLESGVNLVAKTIRLEEAIAAADLVITGEGRIDAQTMRGKTPAGVAAIARRYGKPVVAFAGALAADPEVAVGSDFDAVFSISQRPEPLAAALLTASANLRFSAHQAAVLLRLFSNGRPGSV